MRYVDTNVLLYAVSALSAEAWPGRGVPVQGRLHGGPVRMSVLRAFLTVVNRLSASVGPRLEKPCRKARCSSHGWSPTRATESDIATAYRATPSMTLIGMRVGATRVSSRPAFSYSVRYSSTVRSFPP